MSERTNERAAGADIRAMLTASFNEELEAQHLYTEALRFRAAAPHLDEAAAPIREVEPPAEAPPVPCKRATRSRAAAA
ncbi:MAG: hypothetical protein VW450_02070 [Chloroflexota bacterium]